MSVNVMTNGQFDLKLYSYQTGTPIERIRAALDELGGLFPSWNVEVHDPDEYDPHGRLVIQHSCFNEYTEIVIASRFTGTEYVYDVHHPMETDILTHAEGVAFEDALSTAIEVANRERRRQSRLLPPYTVTNPVSHLLRS